MSTTTLTRAKVQEVKSNEPQSWWIEALFMLATVIVFAGKALWLVGKWALKSGVRKYQVKRGTYKPDINHAGDYKPTVMMDVKPIQKTDFVAADRIFTIPLDPDIGTVHLRLYQEQRRISRDLVISLSKLKGLLQTNRLALPDVRFAVGDSLDEVMDKTVAEFGELISRRGNEMQLKRVKPKKAAPVQASVQAPMVQRAETAEKRVEKPQFKDTIQTAPKGESVGRYLRVGMTYEGKLLSARVEKQNPTDGRKPYDTFVATIRTPHGTIPVRGTELDREMQSKGVKVGDTISIKHLGRVPVELDDGKMGKKNMYEVNKLES